MRVILGRTKLIKEIEFPIYQSAYDDVVSRFKLNKDGTALVHTTVAVKTEEDGIIRASVAKQQYPLTAEGDALDMTGWSEYTFDVEDYKTTKREWKYIRAKARKFFK